jgi:uncharacterized membrane protein YjjP (DUF1212 family)
MIYSFYVKAEVIGLKLQDFYLSFTLHFGTSYLSLYIDKRLNSSFIMNFRSSLSFEGTLYGVSLYNILYTHTILVTSQRENNVEMLTI